jgi:hypothetical protein
MEEGRRGKEEKKMLKGWDDPDVSFQLKEVVSRGNVGVELMRIVDA